MSAAKFETGCMQNAMVWHWPENEVDAIVVTGQLLTDLQLTLDVNEQIAGSLPCNLLAYRLLPWRPHQASLPAGRSLIAMACILLKYLQLPRRAHNISAVNWTPSKNSGLQ